MEEELGGVLQQQQDQAQAAQAGEGETSLSVPPRLTESRGAAAPALLPTPPSPAGPPHLQDSAPLSHLKNFPNTEPAAFRLCCLGQAPHPLPQ